MRPFFCFFYAYSRDNSQRGTVYLLPLCQSYWIKSAWGQCVQRCRVYCSVMVLFLRLLLLGTVPEIIWVTVTSVIGVVALAAGGMGYYLIETKMYERIFLGIAGIVLIVPGLWTDVLGFLLIAVVTVIQLIRKKNTQLKNDGTVENEAGLEG